MTHSDQKAALQSNDMFKINSHLFRMHTKIGYGSSNSDPFSYISKYNVIH